MEISGQVVLITGAAGGIGRALARGFAADGALVVVFDRDERGLGETARDAAGEMLVVGGDVTSAADVQGLTRACIEQHGRIDVLFNNAGIGNMEPFLEQRFERWEEVIRVNLIGAARCSHAVLPGMLERGHGRIVNVISRVAETAPAGASAYAASKAGLVTFTKALAREVDADKYPDVIISAMNPGATETGMYHGQDPVLVYPHAKFVATLPKGTRGGRVYWNSQEYAIYSSFND